MQTEEEDRYGDLEKPIEDVRNVATIVGMAMQPYALEEDGVVKFNDDTWATLLYAIGHLKELIDKLYQQYHRDGEADASSSLALPWTRRSRAAAVAGALALEKSIRMVFTHPAAILANGALHRFLASFRRPQR